MAGTVAEDINYLDSTTDDCLPWPVQLSIPATMRTNFAHTPTHVPIHDLPGKENNFTLNANAIEKTLNKELDRHGERTDLDDKIKRFQIINLWRSLSPNPITDNPLTICDYRSIDPVKNAHMLTVRGETDNTTAYTISESAHDTHM
ncbi:unnamed protein product [Adineta ricciae]|uniref:Uncharacterized protein n=1 Tax=Adineta ricciae TaxID=249248 RepID=A0A815PD08_ADIRI|nr:unnamed protein product [Adineta ricciae]CAF1447509.1 unnamed protein product [Adineta ricciae]